MKNRNNESDSRVKHSESDVKLDSQEQYIIEIKFEIPIYIPIPDGIYNVHVKSIDALVKLRRVGKQSVMSKSVRTSKNIISFVPHLRYDPFNSTEVTIRFKPSPDALQKIANPDLEEMDPYTNGPINPFMKESLLFINKIVDTYQYYSENPTIGKIRVWDIGAFNAQIIPYPLKSPSVARNISGIGYSRSTIYTNGPPIDEENLNRITDASKKDWSISVDRNLLLTARHLYLMGEYSASVITAQTAAEIFLNKLLGSRIKFIRVSTKEKERKIPLDDAGLYYMVEFGLKQAFGKDLSEIDSQLNQEIAEARKLRNDIIHDGIEATMFDADKSIKTFSRAIDLFDSEL